jgi:hypothetical protein
MALLYFNSTQKTAVNWIIRLLLSLLRWPKVILLSGGRYLDSRLRARVGVPPGRSKKGDDEMVR